MSIETPQYPQRDDDKERDEFIAYAGDKDRTRATEKRAIANDETYVDSLRNEAGKKAEFLDRVASSAENNAALHYDAQKLSENMSDEEVEKMANRVHTLKMEAQKEIENIGKTGTFSSPEDLDRQRLEARWKLDNRSKEAEAWDSILYKRKYIK